MYRINIIYRRFDDLLHYFDTVLSFDSVYTVLSLKVLIMSKIQDKMFLLCIYGSENSYRATEYVAKMASLMEAKITLLHVVKNDEAIVLGDDIYEPEGGVMGKRVNAAVSILKDSGVDYVISIQIGDPESVILDMSSKYEAIVMGYKGVNERRIAEMLLGSVSDHVLRHSKKPIVMVP